MIFKRGDFDCMRKLYMEDIMKHLRVFVLVLWILAIVLVIPHTATGANMIEYAIPTGGSQPVDITSGPDGNLWFTESSGNKIGKITTAGSITEYTIPTGSGQPVGITSGPDGNLWFTEMQGNNIGRITTAGVISEYTIPTSSSSPDGITSGPDGNLWFTERSGNKIVQLPPSAAPIVPIPTTTQWGTLILILAMAVMLVVYARKANKATG
ncbi:virginiamycin B hydrolase (VGB) [Candidatus Magnetobacterium bavaricum]|uniref:Virginiamycin B hydrolase (VGB) n=1 Tax=Candidatus Magnetobacterium bavaricum TaxID=29290 RepID=A0A0F3GR20_9BACT|nr:virginiamycin B hydrolase (VGB) [Candidatus Magnetobacterium bavaricum]